MAIMDILVPTYRRPESVMQLAAGLMECKDNRFRLFINSNGFEPSLEYLRSYDNRINYGSFQENIGPHGNIQELITKASSKYVFLLSDEDRIDNNGLVELLDFLQACPKEIEVMCCALYKHYDKHPPRLRKKYYENKCFDIEDVISFALYSPFLSGMIYKLSTVKRLDIEKLLRASPANAYAHQDIAINALSAPTARYVFYRKRVVIEGEQIRLGGDAYSHKTELDEERADGNLDLNPDVYGPYARTMQFFHKEKLHEELYLAGKISLLTKIRAKFKLVGRQVIVVLTSNKVVVLPDGITVMQEAERGFVDAKVNGLVTGTISAKTFIHLLKAPAAIRKFIFSLISLLFGPIKIYQIIKIILLRRCSYW